jgi:hypothetical protein
VGKGGKQIMPTPQRLGRLCPPYEVNLSSRRSWPAYAA